MQKIKQRHIEGLPEALEATVLTTDPRLSDARTPTAHHHDDRYYTEAEIDAALAPIRALIGNETGDADAFINTLREVLAAFSGNPEGLNVANALASKIPLAGTEAGKLITGLLEFAYGQGLKWGGASITTVNNFGLRLFLTNFARVYLEASTVVLFGIGGGAQIVAAAPSYSSFPLEATDAMFGPTANRIQTVMSGAGSLGEQAFLTLELARRYFMGLGASTGNPDSDNVTGLSYNAATRVITLTLADESYQITLPESTGSAAEPLKDIYDTTATLRAAVIGLTYTNRIAKTPPAGSYHGQRFVDENTGTIYECMPIPGAETVTGWVKNA